MGHSMTIELGIMMCKAVVIAAFLGLCMSAIGMWLELAEDEDGY